MENPGKQPCSFSLGDSIAHLLLCVCVSMSVCVFPLLLQGHPSLDLGSALIQSDFILSNQIFKDSVAK